MCLPWGEQKSSQLRLRRRSCGCRPRRVPSSSLPSRSHRAIWERRNPSPPSRRAPQWRAARRRKWSVRSRFLCRRAMCLLQLAVRCCTGTRCDAWEPAWAALFLSTALRANAARSKHGRRRACQTAASLWLTTCAVRLAPAPQTPFGCASERALAPRPPPHGWRCARATRLPPTNSTMACTRPLASNGFATSSSAAPWLCTARCPCAFAAGRYFCACVPWCRRPRPLWSPRRTVFSTRPSPHLRRCLRRRRRRRFPRRRRRPRRTPPLPLRLQAPSSALGPVGTGRVWRLRA